MKVPKTMRDACRVLRARALYVNAALRLPGSNLHDTKRDTEVIREATSTYVRCWILPILNAIERGDTKKLQQLFRSSDESLTIEEAQERFTVNWKNLGLSHGVEETSDGQG